MLVADKIKRPARQAAAIALVSVGALAAVPFLVKVALERINRQNQSAAVALGFVLFAAIPVIRPTATFTESNAVVRAAAGDLTKL